MTRYLTRTCTCHRYVQRHFGLNTVVVFDGYESSNSTKVVEQQRRASKGVSRDLLFNEQIKAVSTQESLLANAKNVSQLIAMILTKFQHYGMPMRCLKIMEATQRTLLGLERNSSQALWCLNSSNTITRATTVPSVDLHYHTYFY